MLFYAHKVDFMSKLINYKEIVLRLPISVKYLNASFQIYNISIDFNILANNMFIMGNYKRRNKRITQNSTPKADISSLT